MDTVLLDTDMLNEFFKARNAIVRRHAEAYLKTHGQFSISRFSHYEVVRGLHHKQAKTQLSAFDTLCQGVLIVPVSDAVLDRAANLWATGRTGGHPHADADLIIAATALESGRTLVTGNTGHFSWIAGLKLKDWRMA